MRIHVEPEDHIHFGIVQDPLLHHQGGPTLFTFRRTFLGRLKNEYHRTTDPVPHAGKHFGRTQQNGHVGVVTTGMTHGNGLAVVLGGDIGGKGQASSFLHGQGVHIGPQRNDRALFFSFQDPDHSRMGDAGPYFQPKVPQLRCHVFCRLKLPVAKFGMPVQVPPVRNDLFQNPGRLDIHRIGLA